MWCITEFAKRLEKRKEISPFDSVNQRQTIPCIFSSWTLTSPQIGKVNNTMAKSTRQLGWPPVTKGKINFSYLYDKRQFCNLKQGAPWTWLPTLPCKLGWGLQLSWLYFRGRPPIFLIKTFRDSVTGKKSLWRFTSQRKRERIYSYKFSKEHALRKGREHSLLAPKKLFSLFFWFMFILTGYEHAVGIFFLSVDIKEGLKNIDWY